MTTKAPTTGIGVQAERSTVHPAVLDDLYAEYARVVDERRWQEWPEMFTEDCTYAVHSLDNVERGLPLAYMLDDCHARLLDRVKFVTEVWAGTVEPYRTRHVIQRLRTEAAGANAYRVRANMVVTYTESDGPPGILASGYYEDLVEITENGPLFAAKKVYLDGIPTRYLVYPL